MEPFSVGEVYVNSLDEGEGHRVRWHQLRQTGDAQSQIRPYQFFPLQSQYPSRVAAKDALPQRRRRGDRLGSVPAMLLAMVGTSLDRKMKMLLVLALLLTLNACQNPSRFQAAQPALGLSRH
jgi:hypothetical protein